MLHNNIAIMQPCRRVGLETHPDGAVESMHARPFHDERNVVIDNARGAAQRRDKDFELDGLAGSHDVVAGHKVIRHLLGHSTRRHRLDAEQMVRFVPHTQQLACLPPDRQALVKGNALFVHKDALFERQESDVAPFHFELAHELLVASGPVVAPSDDHEKKHQRCEDEADEEDDQQCDDHEQPGALDARCAVVRWPVPPPAAGAGGVLCGLAPVDCIEGNTHRLVQNEAVRTCGARRCILTRSTGVGGVAAGGTGLSIKEEPLRTLRAARCRWGGAVEEGVVWST